MLNSRCQSVGLDFSAEAYEGRAPGGFAAEGPGTPGVATLVPCGVCATTFDPSIAHVSIG